MQITQNPSCPHCHDEYTVKNGKTYYGKQNYKCRNQDCRRQFVAPQQAPIEDYKEELLASLLLERISLRGISRVLG